MTIKNDAIKALNHLETTAAMSVTYETTAPVFVSFEDDKDMTVYYTIIKALQVLAGQDSGMVLVPREPQGEFLYELGDLGDGFELTIKQMRLLYAAMIACAASDREER